MKLWISGEIALRGLHARSFSNITNSIEECINKRLETIGYTHGGIEKIRIIFIIRNDNFSVMKGGEGILKKERGEPAYGINIRIDYDTFLNADEKKRATLIFDGIERTIEHLEARKIKNLEAVKEAVDKCKEEF